VDVARISLNPEKKWIRTLQKPPFVDSDSRVKRAEEVSNGVISFDVFLAMNRRAIG
jgi:hypothetical protein